MHLFFDLDGTLTDSFPGISRCINYALTELGRDPAPDATCRSMVGAPLAAIFTSLLGAGDPAVIDRAIEAYRVRFDEVGMFENSLYPGVASALGGFQGRGHLLRIVTVKPTAAARRVILHFGIERFFAAVHGSDLNEQACSKVELLRAALRGVDRREAIMIGDRVDDIVAARENGVRSVAAAWGYGGASELSAAKPDGVASTVAELEAWVHAIG